jgi:hypothetical protein
MHTDCPKNVIVMPIPGILSLDEIVDAVVFVAEAPRVTCETVRVEGGGHLEKWR